MIAIPTNIKIIQVEGYNFPQPKYCFGQVVIDHVYDIGFITGMQYTCGEWEYQLFYTELEVLGVDWLKESNVSLEVADAELEGEHADFIRIYELLNSGKINENIKINQFSQPQWNQLIREHPNFPKRW